MGAATHIGRRSPIAEPDEPAVDEILDHVVALVDDLGRDLAELEEQLPKVLVSLPGSRRPRLALPGWFRRDTLAKAWLSIVAFAAVVAVEYLVIKWFANR